MKKILLGMIVVVGFLSVGCSGVRPQNLGISEGKLAPCPSSPNCVSSQSDDTGHWIAAINYTETQAHAMERMLQVLDQQPRVKIIQHTDDYIYAEFKSALWRFVDDVEFYLDDNEKKIQVRSASRLGYSDLGVNRERIETLRSAFEKIKE